MYVLIDGLGYGKFDMRMRGAEGYKRRLEK